MKHIFGRDVLHRWEGNPLISMTDLSFRCSDILNSAIVKTGEDEFVMLLSVEMPEGYTQLYKSISHDGINFTVNPQPFMSPPEIGPRAVYENFGLRDARITPMDGVYYITYLADSSLGIRQGLVRTRDFKSVEFIGYISQPDVKNGVLFPKKINGKFALLKRPVGGAIWISYSEDLEFWGEEKVVMMPRGGFWDASRIGPGAVPIELDSGWLLVYYGVKDTSAGPLVRLGAALLNKDDPSQIIVRTCVPILSPRENYERIGDVPNVIFSCGAVIRDGELWLYYGASNGCICLARVSLEALCEFCHASHVGACAKEAK